MAEPIVIWGAGAIGGTLGAWWARAGCDVLLVDRVSEHVEACRTTGLTIEGPVDNFTVRVPALTPGEVTGRFDCIVLAVKAHHTPDALAALASHLTDDGFVLSAQNGLNELTIARALGSHRTMGAFLNFGAHWLGPGRVLLGSRGTVVVGELDGPPCDRTRAMHALLVRFEPTAVLTDNVWGYLWGKLAYGAMLFATALTMDPMADNFADETRFAVWRALGREVITTAVTRGITPMGFDGFDPTAFVDGSDEDAARKTVDDLATFNRNPDKTHSGIWRDLVVRQRATEVDAQLAVVVELAAEVGVGTPALRRLVELVHDVEAGRRVPSPQTFEELMAVCR